jgi:hypothetical protein
LWNPWITLLIFDIFSSIVASITTDISGISLYIFCMTFCTLSTFCWTSSFSYNTLLWTLRGSALSVATLVNSFVIDYARNCISCATPTCKPCKASIWVSVARLSPCDIVIVPIPSSPM